MYFISFRQVFHLKIKNVDDHSYIYLSLSLYIYIYIYNSLSSKNRKHGRIGREFQL